MLCFSSVQSDTSLCRHLLPLKFAGLLSHKTELVWLFSSGYSSVVLQTEEWKAPLVFETTWAIWILISFGFLFSFISVPHSSWYSVYFFSSSSPFTCMFLRNPVSLFEITGSVLNAQGQSVSDHCTATAISYYLPVKVVIPIQSISKGVNTPCDKHKPVYCVA